MFAGHVKYIQEAFQDATKWTYGYLLCDLKPETPNDFWLRSNIFPGETQCTYGPGRTCEISFKFVFVLD